MDFSEGLAGVRIEREQWVDSKWGFVNTTGRVVVPLIYDEVRSFSEGMAAVRVGNWSDDTRPKWGFVDRTGREVIPPMFEDVGDFSEGLAAVQIDGRWGYIDQSGQMVIPAIYTLAWAFDDGFARVYYGGNAVWVQPCDGAPTPFGGEWRFINRNGETVASLPYTYVGNAQNGMVPVRIGSDETVLCEERNVYVPINSGWLGDSWGLVRLNQFFKHPNGTTHTPFSS